MIKMMVDQDQDTAIVEASGNVLDIILELTAGAAELFFGLADGNEEYLAALQAAFIEQLPETVEMLSQLKRERAASRNAT